MDVRVIIKVLGGLLVILGVLLCGPAAYALLAMSDSHNAKVFFSVALASVVLGFVAWFSFRSYRSEVNHRTGFAVVSLSWFVAGFVGAFPYWLSGTFTHFIDALFESVSGFSGTGASVITNIEATTPSILLWRSMTQWLGGMGIIVFFIAILPILGIGGVQLFRAETTGPQKDKITPRVRETAKNLWLLYVGFTALLAIFLRLAGMSGYDAVNHAMTTLSTGGFSTKNIGVAAFNSATIDYLIAFFMLIGSINFSLHFRFLVLGDRRALFDTELKGYLSIIVVSTAIFTMILSLHALLDGELAFRAAFFTIMATVSSTGFTHYDYLSWPVTLHLILILLMVMGGMSGSTAGGSKCIRLIAAFKLLYKELRQVVHPHALLSVKTNDRAIKTSISTAIWGFLFIYLLIFSAVCLVLTFDSLDLTTAATAAFSALSNIGPAFGSLGPYDNYSHLSTLSKCTLSIGMVLGRLEFFTVLILITPDFWRR